MGNSTNKRIARNTFFLYTRMIIVVLLSLYITREILNVLGVVDYGIYNVVGGFVLMFAFLSSSMDGTVQRFYNYEKGKENGKSLSVVFSNALVIQIAISIIVVLILETFGIWYIGHKMVIPAERISAAYWCFHFSILSLVLVCFQVPYSAAVLSFEDMDYYAIVSVVEVVMRLIVVLMLPFFNADRLVLYASLLLLVQVIKFLMYFSYAKRKYQDIKWSGSIDRLLLKEMFSFTGWSLIESFAYTFILQGINVVLNAFFGPIVNAARGVAAQIQAGLQGLSSNVVAAFRPQLTESYAQGNNTRVTNYMYTLSKVSYVVLLAFCIPIILELDIILDLWLKGAIPDYTKSFTILVLINMTIGSLNTPLTNVVCAVGDIKNYQIYHSLLVILSVPVAWIAFHFSNDPNLALIIVLLSTILNQPVSMYLLNKVFPFSYKDYIKQVIIPCFIVTILSPLLPLAVYYLIPSSSIIRVSIIVIASVISTAFVSYCFVMNNEERLIGKELIKSFTKKIRRE